MLSLKIDQISGTCCGYDIIKENNKYYRVHKIEISQEVRDGAVNYLNNQKSSYQANTDLSDSAKAEVIAKIDAQLARIAE